MEDIIKVLIADDQTLFRQGLRLLLSVQPDIEVIGEAANGLEVLQILATHHTDVVLMDVEMPALDGISATRAICQTYPNSHVVILTTFENDDYIFSVLQAGAVGYLLKDAPSHTLIEAIRLAARGQAFLQPTVTKRVIHEFNRLASTSHASTPPLDTPLTPREHEILHLLAYGHTNAEIAQRLYITEGTVKNHVTGILSKLGVADRAQAVQRAKALRLT